MTFKIKVRNGNGVIFIKHKLLVANVKAYTEERESLRTCRSLNLYSIDLGVASILGGYGIFHRLGEILCALRRYARTVSHNDRRGQCCKIGVIWKHHGDGSGFLINHAQSAVQRKGRDCCVVVLDFLEFADHRIAVILILAVHGKGYLIQRYRFFIAV